MDDDDELTRLRRRVGLLEDALSGVLELLENSGTISSRQRERLGFPPAAEKAPLDPPFEPPEILERTAGSPYRDAPVPARAAMRCGGCGKWLETDDPELTLASRGRVCTACFVRGG